MNRSDCTEKILPVQTLASSYVDAAILFRDQITTVIEIEESNLRPVHLCGKIL
jgi:hypothetical protein